MNKLKSKVFLTVFSILTLSLLSFIAIFNIQDYMEQRSSVINSLMMATDNNRMNKDFDIKNPLPDFNGEPDGKEPKPLDENTRFMDTVIYTVLLDSENNIVDIINHSNSQFDKNEISEIAQELLSSNNIKNQHIGFLYMDDYSYKYIKGNCLVIIDNEKINDNLLASLRNSIFIFLLLDALGLAVSKLIANRITQPVKESFEKQKQFIADASHELKTPLSVIIASSEAMENDSNPNNKKWIRNIKNEAQRMNSLVTDLLELARNERESGIELEEGNLSKEIELTVLTFEGVAFENGVNLEYDIEDDILIKINPPAIKQLAEILLDNAMKHSFPDSTMHICLKNEKNTVQLIVENEGEEIPAGEEEKIFERFYRTDKSRNRNENRYGLGLAIAKNIAENHNAKISVHSQNGKTVFKVTFKK